jgi:hypothetical protein
MWYRTQPRRRKVRLNRVAAQPILNSKLLTIITPCSRPENIQRVYQGIDFKYVHEWIIVYDGAHVKTNPLMFTRNPKVREYIHTGPGCLGSPQRNFGMDNISDYNTWLFFLDDDNLIHRDLYKFLETAQPGHIYSFDQLRADGATVLEGNTYIKGHVDTASILIDANLVREQPRWPVYKELTYGGDGEFIENLYAQHQSRFVYVNKCLSYHNFLSPPH